MMASNRIRYDVVALLVVIVLMLSGVLTVGEALSGFGNPVVVLVVAGLLVVGEMLARTGVARAVGDWIPKKGRLERGIAVKCMPCFNVVSLAILLLLPVAGTGAAKLVFDPVAACDFMQEEGLRVRGGYRQVGSGYECRSQLRNVMGGGPVNNTIRFSARGDAQRVTELELDLRVNARGAVQRTHGILVDHADALFQRALGAAMTDEIEAAIRAGTDGRWLLNGRSVTLERVPPGVQRYGLRLRIE